MNRLFGKPKDKEPPPSIQDCITGVCTYLVGHLFLSFCLVTKPQGLWHHLEYQDIFIANEFIATKNPRILP